LLGDAVSRLSTGSAQGPIVRETTSQRRERPRNATAVAGAALDILLGNYKVREKEDYKLQQRL